METDSVGLAGYASAFVERAGVSGDAEGPGLLDHVAPADLERLALLVGGTFHVSCYDAAGNLKWRDRAKNGVTSIGLDHVLNVIFRGTTPITTWFIGLVDFAGFSAFSLADIATSHASWSAVASGDLGNATWPAWSPGAPSSNAITNATTANFTMQPSGSLTVKGLFLVSNSTVSPLAGLLFSTASFTGGTQAVSNGDVLKVTYTISAANNPSNT